MVRFGASGLLIPTTTDNTRWRPFDYLLDEATAPVPEGFWDTALVHTGDPNTLFATGFAAHDRGLLTIAETSYRKAAEGGHTAVMFNLGNLLDERGKTGEAEQ